MVHTSPARKPELHKESANHEGRHINVFCSEEDACYVADIPDLKFCSAFGETPEVAVREVVEAKLTWIEAAQASGKPVPRLAIVLLFNKFQHEPYQLPKSLFTVVWPHPVKTPCSKALI